MRLYLRSADRRPDPPPLRTNDRAVILAGLAVWAVLLAAALALHSRLVADGRGWWMWTPVAGIVLGLYGLRYVRKRDARPAADPSPSPTPAGTAPTGTTPTGTAPTDTAAADITPADTAPAPPAREGTQARRS